LSESCHLLALHEIHLEMFLPLHTIQRTIFPITAISCQNCLYIPWNIRQHIPQKSIVVPQCLMAIYVYVYVCICEYIYISLYTYIPIISHQIKNLHDDSTKYPTKNKNSHFHSSSESIPLIPLLTISSHHNAIIIIQNPHCWWLYPIIIPHG
jgi:hypothetical protein